MEILSFIGCFVQGGEVRHATEQKPCQVASCKDLLWTGLCRTERDLDRY